MITIHGGALSPFVRKAHIFCREKGIAFETTALSPIPKTPELLAMNPLGKIPILETEDGTYVPDSSVICVYLERVHPEPALYPEDPKQLARALYLEEWADTLGVATFSNALFERVIKPRFLDQKPDEEAVAHVRDEKAPPVLDYLDTVVDESGCAVGGRFSIADCAIGTQLQNWALAEITLDADRWPNVWAYADAVLSRPSFEAVGEMIRGG
jgi:glutathione S-transferase